MKIEFYIEYIEADTGYIVEIIIIGIGQHLVGVRWVHGVGIYITFDEKPLEFFASWDEVRKVYG